MKSFMLAIVSAISLLAYAGDDASEDGYVYVDVPVSCKIGSATSQFGDMELTFSKIYIDDSCYERKTIKEAMSGYASFYAEFLCSQTDAGLKVSVANANMPLWCQAMQSILESGRAAQISYEEALIKDAEGATTQAAMDIASLNSAAAERIYELDTLYPTAALSIQGALAISASAVASAIDSIESDLKSKIEDIQNNASESAKQEACQCAADIAVLKSKQSEFATNIKKVLDTVNPFASIAASVTNNFVNISLWLGNTNKNNGVFMRPTNPNGIEYPENYSILSYLNDYGFFTYLDLNLAENESLRTTSRCFFEDLDGDTTNVYSCGFASAPCDWVDGSTVICTDGVYSIHQDYRFVTNIVWTTNWTDAVENITNTHEVVDVVTNLVVRYNTITTQVYKVEAFTNWHEMVEWTTNFTVNVTSNSQSVLNIVTNTINHDTFVTNFLTHEVMFTDVISREIAITNFINVCNIRRDSEERGEEPTEEERANDPYDYEYEHTEDKDELLPVKNALMLVAITNAPFSKISPDKTLDHASIWTNELGKVEIVGFSTDGIDDEETKGIGYVPARDVDENGNYIIRWTPDLLGIVTSDVNNISLDITKNFDIKSIYNMTVTNNEDYSAMATQLFSRVAASGALDNASIWTNGEGKAEIKGFSNDSYPGMIPCVGVSSDESKIIYWTPHIEPDGAHKWFEVFYTSIDCVEASGVSSNLVAEIAGFWKAETNTFPVKVELEDGRGDAEYAIEWRPVPTGGSSTSAFAIKDGALVNCFYGIGGRTYSMGSYSVSAANGKILAVYIGANSSTASASYKTYDSLSALQSAQDDLTSYIMPLYQFDDDGNVVSDMRSSLTAVMLEF